MSVIEPYLRVLTGPGMPFEIVVETVHGHPVRTYRHRIPHLREFVRIGEGHGDREFLVQGSRRVGYRTAFNEARRLATALLRRYGVEPGDRVAVVGANAIEWVVAYWAAVAADAIVVPLNAWWAAPELRFGLEDSGAVVALADGPRAEALAGAGFPAERTVVWGDGDRPSGTTAFGASGEEEPVDTASTPARGEDETAVIFYTSGTTGRPKGSANTHRNVVTNFLNAAAVAAAAAAAVGYVAGEQDVDLVVVPLFHATANLAVMTPFVFAGHRMVFMPPGPFDPEVAADLIERERVTRFGGVPTIVARMLDAEAHRGRDFSSVRTITYGGAPASPALLARAVAAFPGLRERMVQGYGLTETSSIATLNMGPDYLARPASVGIAAPSVELRIAGPGGDPLPAGEVGEVWIRGANVIPGYWGRDDPFTDGFLHTGDLGYLDEDGFLYITDRAKDVVIRGGENVYSAEVEAVLEAHPVVREAAVVGSPHPDLGEEVKAIVVTAGPVTEASLAEHVARHLAAFKVPTLWEVRTEPLPRNPSGKVLKARLRGGRPGLYAVGETDSAL